MQRDQEWSGTITDVDKFVSFLTADASIYPPGMPIATGEQAIREMHKAITSSPGFSVRCTAARWASACRVFICGCRGMLSDQELELMKRAASPAAYPRKV